MFYASFHQTWYKDKSLSFILFSLNKTMYVKFILKVIAFTIQRLIVVCSPLSNRFKSKSSAWRTVASIVFLLICSNLWVLFMFELKEKDEIFYYCDTKPDWSVEYMIFTLVYIAFVMLLPILIVFVSNSVILSKTRESEKLRCNTKKEASSTSSSGHSIAIRKVRFLIQEEIKPTPRISSDVIATKKKTISIRNQTIKPFYMNMSQIISRLSHQANDSKKLTKVFTFLSFSFLNLPYFVSWCLFYYQFHFKHSAAEEMFLDQIDAANKLTEIAYTMNYSIHFLIYVAISSVFRQQLKYSSKILKFIEFMILTFV